MDFNGTKATQLEYGSGHLSPNSAMDPGLAYKLSLYDYLGYLCNRHYNKSMAKKFIDPEKYPCPKSFDMASFIYPSIAIPDFKGSVTVTRRVKNVGTPSSTYNVQVTDIPGIPTAVEPNRLTFMKSGEERTFKITFISKENAMPKDYVFGELTWSDGYPNVRSPIALKA